MGVQFFGEFLIDRWVITRGQLIEALELQEYRNIRFGAVAVKKGYLTEEQVEQVNERQKTADKKIADLAVEMDLLTEEQAQEVLTFHRNNHLFLGEALLELGHITEDVLDRELEIFKEEQAVYDLETVTIPEGLYGSDAIEVSVDFTRKMFRRIAGYLIKVDQGVLAEDTNIKNWGMFSFVVMIVFKGAKEIRYILGVSREVAEAVAASILKESVSNEPDEIIADAVCEFSNLICGNAVAKLAQKGINVDIEPPQVLPNVPLANKEEGQQTLVFPVYTASEGMLDLRYIIPVD
jgi:CheY-specific phosphatase CheX